MEGPDLFNNLFCDDVEEHGARPPASGAEMEEIRQLKFVCDHSQKLR